MYTWNIVSLISLQFVSYHNRSAIIVWTVLTYFVLAFIRAYLTACLHTYDLTYLIMYTYFKMPHFLNVLVMYVQIGRNIYIYKPLT